MIGTGAYITHPDGQVGLQLARPAGPLDIARATAREDADGHAGNWAVYAMAICADRWSVGSPAVYGTLGDRGGSAECPPDKRVHSVGGGGSLVDTGPHFLEAVYPHDDLRSWEVWMTGPLSDQVAIGAVCAY